MPQYNFLVSCIAAHQTLEDDAPFIAGQRAGAQSHDVEVHYSYSTACSAAQEQEPHGDIGRYGDGLLL